MRKKEESFINFGGKFVTIYKNKVFNTSFYFKLN